MLPRLKCLVMQVKKESDNLRKRHNQDENFTPSSGGSMCSKKPILRRKKTHASLSSSLPQPMVSATALMSPVLPLTQIQITQQPTSCSQTSMTYPAFLLLRTLYLQSANQARLLISNHLCHHVHHMNHFLSHFLSSF